MKITVNADMAASSPYNSQTQTSKKIHSPIVCTLLEPSTLTLKPPSPHFRVFTQTLKNSLAQSLYPYTHTNTQ